MTEKLKVELVISKNNFRDDYINPLNDRFVVCIVKHLYGLVDIIHELNLIKL